MKMKNERTFSKQLKALITLLAVTVLVSLAGSPGRGSVAVGQSDWAVPARAKETKNPVPADAASVKKGQELFKTNCALCHGATGAGDGMMAAKLKPQPAPISKKTLGGQTDGELFWKISEGKLPMPAFKKSIAEKDRWSLVNYVRTL